MKNLLSFLLPAAIMFSGCTQEELRNSQPDFQDGRTFTASFEQDRTRTYVEDGNLLRWTAGDQISLFDGNTLNRQYKFDGETGDNSGTFSIVSKPFGTGNALSANYAVYPYSSDVKITETGVITATLPAEQNYAYDSFGLGANTMVAVTKDIDDTFLKFKNVCGYLKIRLYGDDITVKSISLTGNDNEGLAGKASVETVYGDEPKVVMSDEATSSITLNCGEGVKVGSSSEAATAFWIAVPPTTFERGFEITVTDINGNTFTKSTSNEITVERNVIKPMKAFEVERQIEAETIPDNQIWYISSDGEIIAPLTSNEYAGDFGASIISNTYENGKGIITFNGPVRSIGNRAFYERWTLIDITLPESVATIGDAAFSGCDKLNSITIPDNVTSLGGNAFFCCEKLATVTMGNNVKSIGENAFYNCESLITIDIPNSVVKIGYGAFSGCRNLTDIYIGDNVAEIGNGAFYMCESLTDITLPNSVTTIGENPFAQCFSLRSFEGKYSEDNGRVLIKDNRLIAYANASGTVYSVPDGITTIGNTAFYCCFNLTSVSLPNSLTTIEDTAFYECINLTSLNIPDNVTIIGNSAFCYCDKLLEITIPKSVKEIGDYAFHGCRMRNEIYCEATTPPIIYRETFSGCSSDLEVYVPAESIDAYKSAYYWKNLNIREIPMPDNQIWYTSSDGNIISPYKSKGFDANIESNIYVDGKGVITFDDDITKIYASAFENCATLVNIKLPDSVSYLGPDAFSGCSSLVAIDIPRISTIYEYTFSQCTALVSVNIPDTVTKIEDDAFGNCKSLKNIALPNSLITIGGFMGCEFSEIIIPESVKIIGPHAFDNCKNLSKISIPDGVETIGNYAFDDCTSLNTLVIPDNVKVIGDQAFYNCSGLTSIIIGDNVRNIGFNAFRRCTGVSTLTLPSCIETIGDSAFADMQLTSMTCLDNYPPSKGDPFWSGENNNKIDVLYVPSGAKDNYSSNPNWNNHFKSIIEVNN